MNDTPESPDDNELNGPGELSEDDLAVLRAFEAAEELLVKDASADVSAPGSSLFEQSYATQSPQSSPGEIPEEMLVLFVTEADEDITAMRETLHHLEQDDPADSASLTALQRTAHKLKGTAGSIGYERISTIAQYVEKFVAAVKNGTINNLAGLIAIMHAIQALEATLYGIAADGQESDTPLAELEVMYTSLNIDIHTSESAEKMSARETRPLEPLSRSAAMPTVQVDARHLEHLILHIEQLAEQRPSLARAQVQVESAQQELFAAQARLQHLEVLLATVSLSWKTPDSLPNYEPAAASLVARILNEAARRIGHTHRARSRSHFRSAKSEIAQGIMRWDELLSEAISDVVTASSRLRLALAQLNQALQKQVTQTTMVRNVALRLPHAPKAVRGLLVEAGDNGQRVVVPFSQLRRIDYKIDEKHNPLYTLNALLGLPERPAPLESTRPVLILEGDGAAVQVDEVLGEVEVMLKPLATHLQRPGIMGTATDGLGHVLVLVDLPGLLMHTDEILRPPVGADLSRPQPIYRPLPEELQREGSLPQKRWTVLIADDSVYIRQSVLQVLTHASYDVLEARDGLEALERLLSSSIDVLLLDIEMPNLNGYELL